MNNNNNFDLNRLMQQMIGQVQKELNDVNNYLKQNKGEVSTGNYGEWLTEQELSKNNIDGYYLKLHNLYIPYNNSTSEIDIIMIHQKGIYVFESKNYSGWIFGSAEQQKWTQMINRNSKYQFYNPILQNQTHITALSKYANVNKNFFKSYIVFSERCELKKVPANTDNCKIIKRNDMLKTLKKDLDTSNQIFMQSEVNKIYEKLKITTNASQKVKQQHVNNINNKYRGY